MEFTEYKTKTGDRMDTIAVKVFGDPHQWGLIIEHNPGLPIQDFYEGGITIKVPIISAQEVNLTNSTNLPPWKR